MKILIKNIKGEVFDINCDLDETVLDAKKKITSLKKLDPEMQKLIIKGAIASNERKLKDYELKENDFMVLMISKKPANPQPAPIQTEQEQKPISSKPSIESNLANGTGLVFGEALEQTIENMTSMGFERNEVIRALHAAYHNPDKALDYLFNGIPDIYVMEQELHTNPSNILNSNSNVAVNQDELAIERLSSLGFSREAASSAYYASGKNENMAANILFYNQSNNEEVENDEENGENE